MARVSPVTATEFAKALGITRRTLDRWLVAGRLPVPGRTEGRHRRWPVAVAIEELEKRGLGVPTGWRREAPARRR